MTDAKLSRFKRIPYSWLRLHTGQSQATDVELWAIIS